MARNSQRLKLQYAGMTASPDDYLSPDGELLTCIGLEDQNGAKMSALRHGPKELCRMTYTTSSGDTVEYEVLYLHEMALKTIALLKCTTGSEISYWWMDVTTGWPASMQQSETTALAALKGVTILDVKSLGNTLVMRSASSMHYALWKEGTYKYLGTKIPELPIMFGLQTEYCHYMTGYGIQGTNNLDETVDDDDDSSRSYFQLTSPAPLSTTSEDYHYKITDSSQGSVTTDVMAKVNKCIAEGMERGYFMQPFLVRYALKMYDGTTTMASAPIYMPVCHPYEGSSMPFALRIRSDQQSGAGFINKWYINYCKAVMDYSVDASALATLKEWSDVIKGVTIAVTAPIYGYYPGGKIENVVGGTLSTTAEDSSYFYNMRAHRNIKSICKILPTSDDTYYAYRNAVSCFTDSDFYEDGYGINDSGSCGYPYSAVQLPVKTQAEFDKEVKEASVFYIYKELKLDEIQTTRTVLQVNKGILSTIQNQPTLDDEYNSHDTTLAGYMYTYNGRLNMCNVTRTLWNGFDPKLLVPYQDKYDMEKSSYYYERTLRIVWEVTEGDNTNRIASADMAIPYSSWACQYIYYPNTNVGKVWFVVHTKVNALSTTKDYYSLIEKSADEHTGLNGSVLYDLIETSQFAEDTTTNPTPILTDGNVPNNNKLYTSDALNPWVFQPKNINTVGNSKILGLAVAKKAISLGQAGIYPMYCMTEDGVWIMSPNDTGGWASKQPIMTDVCTVPEAIMETDGAVVMPTKRGLILLQGEQAACLTDVNHKANSISPSDLPGLANVVQTTWGFDCEQIDRDLFVDIEEYMQSTLLRGTYDYKNNRVLYYRSDRDYSVMLTFGEQPMICLQKWNLLSAPGHVSGCPVMIEQGGQKYIAELSGDEGTVIGTDTIPLTLSSNALIVTRPIKGTDQGIRDMRKQLDTVWHQGRYKRGSLDILLYGTVDYDKWYLIGQAKNATGLYGHHGQHWMAFILVVCAKGMQTKDAIDCVDLTMTPRLSDKSAAIQGYK